MKKTIKIGDRVAIWNVDSQSNPILEGAAVVENFIDGFNEEAAFHIGTRAATTKRACLVRFPRDEEPSFRFVFASDVISGNECR